MKKLLVLFLLLAFTSFAMSADFALDAGAKKIDGTIYFRARGGDLYDDTSIAIAPSFGFFLTKGLVVNLNFEFATTSSGGTSYDSIFFGGGLDYYIGAEKGKQFVPFIGAKALYGSDTASTSYFNIILNAGGAIFLNDHVSLDVVAEFYLVNATPDGSSTSVSGNIFQIGLGISAYLF